MQGIRLEILLPLSQLILAAALLTVGQHLDIQDKYEPRPPSVATRVCFALNAPALVSPFPHHSPLSPIESYRLQTPTA